VDIELGEDWTEETTGIVKKEQQQTKDMEIAKKRRTIDLILMKFHRSPIEFIREFFGLKSYIRLMILTLTHQTI
jgi:hypothetical protein